MKQPLFIMIGLCLMVISLLPVEFRDEEGIRLKHQKAAKVACFVAGLAAIASCLWWFR